MQNKFPKRLSIIIPVFNESNTVKQIIDRVLAVKLDSGWEKEIIVVDDKSTDGTSQMLKNIDPAVKVIYKDENGGKGAALKMGFKEVTGDYVLIQDADFEYDPEDYNKLLEPIKQGHAEIIFGSRVNSSNIVPFKRIFFYGGLFINKIFNFLFRSNFSDIATCYKLFPKRFLSEIKSNMSDDFVFDVIELPYLLFRSGQNIKEVPIKYESRGREKGKKMSWRHGSRCFFRILSIFIGEKIFWIAKLSRKVSQAYSRFIVNNKHIPIILTFSLFFIIFFLMYFNVSTLASGDDHYFHFRFAEQIRENGFFNSFTDFKSIYLTKIAQGNEYFIYYNFLFYLIILPFSYLDPLYLGIKLYAVFAAAIAFVLLYWCLKQVEIKRPFVWVLLIVAITNTKYIWRFFLSRPYTLAPSLLLLLLIFLYKKNYIGVFGVSLIYLYWHGATFFMPLGVACVYFVMEYFFSEKKDWKLLGASFFGTVLSVLIAYIVSHGFLIYLKDNILGPYIDTIIGKKISIPEGVELYPVEFFNFIQSNALIFAAFVTAVSVDVYSYIALRMGKVDPKDYYMELSTSRRYLQGTIFLITTLLFLGTVTVSGRFNDYFTMFAGLYIALSFDFMLRSAKFEGSSVMLRGIAVGLVIVLTYLFASNILFLQNRIAYGNRTTEMYQVGTWLSKNTAPGDIVFNVNWSWFPQLYYYSPHNYYVTGLEPRLTYAYSPRLYWLWSHISEDGYICELESCPVLKQKQTEILKNSKSLDDWAIISGDLIAKSLREDFNSHIVVTHRDNLILNYILGHNSNFKQEIYDSQFGYSVYSLKK